MLKFLRFGLMFVCLFTLGLSASLAQDTVENGCVVTAPPSEMKLDPFYSKYCGLEGIPILSSAAVPDAALQRAWDIASHLLQTNPDLAKTLANNHVRIGVIGANEMITNLPDYKDLYTLFPGTDWDTRTRGLGATATLPMTSGAEENLLCYQRDNYRGEDIFVHEFSHTVKIMALQYLDSTFESTVLNAYNAAIASGLWADTYAATDPEEYWAEGVQDYFNVNLESDPANGIHNSINTRDELKAYDPTLFALIDHLYSTLDWQPTCPETSQPSVPCSGTGTTATNILFENDSQNPVELFWVNQACEETSYGVIQPGNTVSQPTYGTHAWAIRGSDGSLLQTYTASDSSSSTHVVIGLACSANGPATQVLFDNQSSGPVELFWVNRACEETSYGVIQPGSTLLQPTYATHAWNIRGSDGTLIQHYTAKETLEPIHVTIGFPCSQTGPATQITFQNNHKDPVMLLWLNYECEEILYTTIPSGQSVLQPTYATHGWITRAESGEIQNFYAAQESPMTVDIP